LIERAHSGLGFAAIPRVDWEFEADEEASFAAKASWFPFVKKHVGLTLAKRECPQA